MRAVVVLASLLLAAPAWAQPETVERLAAGRFLVAAERVLDPNFAQSVVLLLEYSEEGALGLVVNQPTDIRLTTILPDGEQYGEREDRVFIGGPVEREKLLLLVRSETEPEGFQQVFGEVWTGGEPAVIERMFEAGAGPESIRGYVGYAGWGPGQLDMETLRGDWVVLPAAAAQVFDPAPSDLWQRLMEGRKVRFALLD